MERESVLINDFGTNVILIFRDTIPFVSGLGDYVPF